MELELRQETLRCWEAVCRTAVEQEETAEVIVPDSCPDIWQVLDGSGMLLLQRKEAQEGAAELAGLIRVTVLYQPEGENTICSMEATLPIHAAPACHALTRRCVLRATPAVLSTDIHLLNPRKILVRVSWQVELEGYAPNTLSLPTYVENGEGIRQKTEPFQTLLTVSVQEKLFAYSDTVSLGRPDVTEVVRMQAGCGCSEARVIGNRLVFKGEAEVELLCRGEEGSLFSQTFRLPYSQLMDVGEESEEGDCDVTFLFSEAKCALQEDGQSFQIDLTLQAQAAVRREMEVQILTDLYSTTHEVTLEEEPLSGQSLLRESREQEGGRVRMETGDTPGEPLDVQVRLGRRTQHTEGEEVVLEQEAEAVVLYRGEDGPACARQRAVVSHRMPKEPESTCLFSTELLRTPTVSSAGDGLEVVFPLGFHCRSLAEKTGRIISGVISGEKRERGEDAPSLIIRSVQPGETLWDIAKESHTTESAILEAGGLTSGDLIPGQRLLIPG